MNFLNANLNSMVCYGIEFDIYLDNSLSFQNETRFVKKIPKSDGYSH